MYKALILLILLAAAGTVHAVTVDSATPGMIKPILRPDFVTVCPANYAPVCSESDKTYSSDCEARAAGAVIKHRGTCEDGPLVPKEGASTTPPVRKVVPLHNDTSSSTKPRTPIFLLRDGSTTTARDLGGAMRKNPTIERARSSIKRSLVFLEAGITRAERLIDRVEARLSKMGDKDTSAAEALIAEAKAELEAARALLDELKAGIDAVQGESTKETFAAAKDAIHTINNEHLKSAMDLIREALRTLTK